LNLEDGFFLQTVLWLQQCGLTISKEDYGARAQPQKWRIVVCWSVTT